MIWLGLYREFSTPKNFCDEKKICEDLKIHKMPRIFFRRRKISGSKIFYTNLIISSEKLFSMPPSMGMLRDPAVPAIDFRGISVIFSNSHYRQHCCGAKEGILCTSGIFRFSSKIESWDGRVPQHTQQRVHRKQLFWWYDWVCIENFRPRNFSATKKKYAKIWKSMKCH